jgi:lipoprotein NlpD
LGNIIEIEHADGYKTLFGHCQNRLKRVGEDVIRGEVIATVGNTGSITTGPHLHYQISKNGINIDPKQLIIRGF